VEHSILWFVFDFAGGVRNRVPSVVLLGVADEHCVLGALQGQIIKRVFYLHLTFNVLDALLFADFNLIFQQKLLSLLDVVFVRHFELAANAVQLDWLVKRSFFDLFCHYNICEVIRNAWLLIALGCSHFLNV